MCLILGTLAALTATGANSFITAGAGTTHPPDFSWWMWLALAATEESAKAYATLNGPYANGRDRDSAGPYAAATAAGFTAVENVIYTARFGPMVMLGRAPITTPMHLLISLLWAWTEDHSKTISGERARWLAQATALGGATATHALFNAALTGSWKAAGTLAGIAGVALLARAAGWNGKSNRASPDKEEHSREKQE